MGKGCATAGEMLLGANVFVVGLLSMPCCNVVGREKQQLRGWEEESVSEADVVSCRRVEASSRPQEAAAPASSLPRTPSRPLYFNVVCKL